ncbi:MAG: RHS repeat protein [Parachlamydiaceae bacterium]|nr:RHS repeat protein [Parachlamydiaceae bacterium]
MRILLTILFFSLFSLKSYAVELPTSVQPIYQNVHVIHGTLQEAEEDSEVIPEYYQMGMNEVAKTSIFIQNTEDSRLGKVKSLKTSQGKLISSYIYSKGYTDTFNALNYKTRYEYSENNITAIRQYDVQQQLYRSELLFWNEKNQLTSQAFANHTQTLFTCRTFTYDDFDNIIVDTLHGNLSGACAAPLLLDETGQPVQNGIEQYSKTYKYTYRKDAEPLLKIASEDNGLVIHYAYDLSSSKITAKYISDADSIRIRHFYFYDSNGFLTKTVIDNGKNWDINDLHGVSEQYTTLSKLSKGSKGQPVVESVEELFYNFSSLKEIVLKRTFLVYSSNDQLLQKEIFDGEGKRSEALYFAYDSKGNLISIIDHHGNVTKYSYHFDGKHASFQPAKEEHSSVFSYRFDTQDHLISSLETATDGTTKLNSYLYDQLGNRTSSIDSLGNETLCEYDAFGRLATIRYPRLSDTRDGPKSPVEERSYDILNRIVKVTDTLGKTTTTRYNARGKQIEICHSDKTKELFRYALDGTLAESIGQNKTRTVYTTDFLGRVTRKESFDSSGKAKTVSTMKYKGFHIDAETHSETSDVVDANLVNTLYGLYGKLSAFASQLSSILKSYSFEESIANNPDELMLQMCGKPYLVLSGYYVDNMDAGVFGTGEFGNHVRVTAINGVLNIRKECIETIETLSSTHGGINIHYVFYPTEGWAIDIFKAAIAKWGYVSPQVKLLAHTWRRLIQDMGGSDGGGTIIHYAHSIGGTNTSLALELMSPAERKMIHVVTVGTATVLPNQGFGSVVNYISKRDGVSRVVTFVSSVFNPPANAETPVYVGSHLDGLPIIDHLMTGETYRRVMAMLGESFLRSYGPNAPVP